jgi:hypothetical protein
MEPDALVTLELKCCCCGVVLESLRTHWRLEDVQTQSIWTRQPCAPCERSLAREDAVRTLPADLREEVFRLLEAGVDVDLSHYRA